MYDLQSEHQKLIKAIETANIVIAPYNPSFRPIAKNILESIKNDETIPARSTIQHMISFSNKPGEHDLNKRQRTTVGRFLRKRFKIIEGFPSYFLEQYSQFIINELVDDPDYLFDILRGEAVEQAYYDEIGGHSCMTGHCSVYVRLYAENPDKVGLLVYMKKKARALIWNTDEGDVLIDRVYPNKGQHILLYKKYAKKHGYIMTRDENDNFTEYGKYNVYLDLPSNNLYPYMDTFIYGDKTYDGLRLSNSYFLGCVELCETNGRWPGEYICARCGETVDREYTIYVGDEQYCEDCVFMCSCCEEYICIDEAEETVDGLVCNDCLENHYFYCNCGNTVHYDDTHVVENEKICQECYENETIECENCGEIVFADNAEKTYAGEDICEECSKECENCGEILSIDDMQDGERLCEECRKDEDNLE